MKDLFLNGTQEYLKSLVTSQMLPLSYKLNAYIYCIINCAFMLTVHLCIPLILKTQQAKNYK